MPVPAARPGRTAGPHGRAARSGRTVGPHGRAARSGRTVEVALVADLRRAASLYPDDPQLGSLLVELRAQSPRFAELWDSGAVAAHRSERKTITTALVSDITLDCDILTVPDSDLKIVVYTATPGTADAEKLEFLRVSGLRAFQADWETGAEV